MVVPRAQTKAFLLVASLQLTSFVMGCHHDGSNNDECTQGDTESCVGKGDCDGTRSCNDSGEYGKCVCDETGETTGTNTSTNNGNEPVPLGTSCSEDSDCPKGATCLTTDSTAWLGGAPTEGICVADCSLDDSVCDDFADATCVESSRQGGESIGGTVSNALCLPSCSPAHGSLDEPACEATPGSLCEPLTDDGMGICRPVCNFDEQCASGHCDRQLSVCVANATHYEVELGTSCDPDANTCNGVCLTLSTGYSVCSARCRFGSAEECGSSSASELSAVCAFAAPDGGLGDLGYCAELCDCDDDCSHKDFVCEAFPSASLQTTLGHQGICTAPVDSIGETHDGTSCNSSNP